MRLGTTTKFRIRYSRIANEPLRRYYISMLIGISLIIIQGLFKKSPRGPIELKFYSFVGGTLMTIRFVRVN